MDLLAPPVELADLAESSHTANQQIVVGLGFEKDRPILAFGVRAARSLPGLGDVEDEDASREQRFSDTPEKTAEFGARLFVPSKV